MRASWFPLLLAVLCFLVGAGACSSKSSIENPSGGSGGIAGTDASAGSGGVSGSAGGNTGGSAGGGGTSGSGGVGGAAGGGSGGNSGTGGGGGSNCKGKGFTFKPDPPNGGNFQAIYTDVENHEDIRLEVQCNGTATVQFIKNDGGCLVAGPPPCEWHYQVTKCGPGPATISFYKDAKEGGSGMKVAECIVQLM